MVIELTIAAISDIHINKYPIQKSFFDGLNSRADILLIGGDIHDGDLYQVEEFVNFVRDISIPIIVIFGNHDVSNGNSEEIKNFLKKHSKIILLDGDYTEFEVRGKRVGVAATKGFGGGFAPYRIVGRGEEVIQSFIKEEQHEVKKLKEALMFMTQSSPDYRIVMTHWAPFEEVIEGEPLQLYPLLGSSLLGDCIYESKVHLALSGHAHHASAGIKKARGKISACNIAYKVNNGKVVFFEFTSPEDVTLSYGDSQ